MTELKHLVRTERLAFIDLLKTLTEDQWRTPSLCSAWTVENVAAHLAWAPVGGPLEMVPGAPRGGVPCRRGCARPARWPPDPPPERRVRREVDRARPSGDLRPAAAERRERRQAPR